MTYYKVLTDDYSPVVIGDMLPGEFDNNLKDFWNYSTDEYARMFPDDWEEISEEEYLKQEGKLKESETANVKPYYKGRNSLYQFAEEHELNSYEFDIIKRVARCRHKGNWLEDLEKTKGVIDIYIKECKEGYNG